MASLVGKTKKREYCTPCRELVELQCPSLLSEDEGQPKKAGAIEQQEGEADPWQIQAVAGTIDKHFFFCSDESDKKKLETAPGPFIILAITTTKTKLWPSILQQDRSGRGHDEQARQRLCCCFSIHQRCCSSLGLKMGLKCRFRDYSLVVSAESEKPQVWYPLHKAKHIGLHRGFAIKELVIHYIAGGCTSELRTIPTKYEKLR